LPNIDSTVPLPLKDEDDLVGAAVPVVLELAVRRRRLVPIRDHVLVEHHRDASV
jgi:hypothetical protein